MHYLKFHITLSYFRKHISTKHILNVSKLMLYIIKEMVLFIKVLHHLLSPPKMEGLVFKKIFRFHQ